MKHLLIFPAIMLSGSAVAQTAQQVLDQVRPGQLETIQAQEQTLVETCPAGIWFDDRCRGQRFWKDIRPDGEAFASAFGNAARAPGEIGSAVLITVDDGTVREYHLVGNKRETPSTIQGGLVATLNEGAFPAAASQHLFDYDLLSRVTVTKGETDGYASIYYEVAVPEENGDLGLYYSILREYGASGSYDQVECTSDRYLADKGLRGPAECVTASRHAQNGISRQGCLAPEEAAAFAIGGAASQECGNGVDMIASGGKFRPHDSVLADVARKPDRGAGLTFAAALGGGEVTKERYCRAVSAVQEDLSGHATACETSGFPISPDELADIYEPEIEAAEILNAMLGGTGSCGVCEEYATEWVGRVWDENDGAWTDIYERVCTDWTWGEPGVDENNDLFCD
jgi:hypothetical protein